MQERERVVPYRGWRGPSGAIGGVTTYAPLSYGFGAWARPAVARRRVGVATARPGRVPPDDDTSHSALAQVRVYMYIDGTLW